MIAVRGMLLSLRQLPRFELPDRHCKYRKNNCGATDMVKTSKKSKTKKQHKRLPKWASAIICIVVFIGFFMLFSAYMGLPNTLNTMMNTAYSLLIDTVFYIMAIAVLMGAISSILSEFGVIDLINKILSPLMKPIYGLPGAAALGIVTTFLSDNPAILSLAENTGFRRYFKRYQLYALTNLGTAFGMGLIICTFMIGQGGMHGQNYVPAVLIGLLGAVIGSVVSTRLMLIQTKKIFGTEAECVSIPADLLDEVMDDDEKSHEGVAMRIMDCILGGGKNGVNIGLSIIPGVLIVCTVVMMLTYSAPEGGYTGGAYEGIGLIPFLADKIKFILNPLFGFSSSEAIAVPITALGAAGAAIGLVPEMIETGAIGSHDIAVFTAMCMCWSGYLSTHVSMMSSLGRSDLSGKAIGSHTIGGLIAGIAANWLYKLIEVLAH